MIAFVEGQIIEKNPAYVVIDVGGIGYWINISLTTYSQIENDTRTKLHTYFYVKEDIQSLYGFSTINEKNIFTHLISVSGIGPNTARMMLSSMDPSEIRSAIIHDQVVVIQKIKGIGPKSAKRLILELKDKMIKEPEVEGIPKNMPQHNRKKDEALSALVMLGFAKSTAEKTLDKLETTTSDEVSVEELIKLALKQL